MNSIDAGWRSSSSHLPSRRSWRLIRSAINGLLSCSPIPSALPIRLWIKTSILVQVFSPSTLTLYIRLLRTGKKLQSHGKDDYYQAGGDFLVDHEGNIFFAHQSQDPADRPAPEKLLKAIDRTASSTRSINSLGKDP